jgi:L,D-peptidoglycan transpeptidase YkuD (ErfK/YbiS/YcfS/YnhG family)
VKPRAISEQFLQMKGERNHSSMIRDARNGFMVLVVLMGQYLAANETSQTAGARFDPPLQLRASIPEISKCRQLIVVTTENWNATSATIRLFERTQGGRTSWQIVGKPFSGVIGRREFAWGIGLHGTGEAGAPRKREGDDTSPAGVFRLCSVFGLANPTQVLFLRLPYQQITTTTEAIDDPQSRYYNRILHWKCCDQVQSGFQVEEVPAFQQQSVVVSASIATPAAFERSDHARFC